MTDLDAAYLAITFTLELFTVSLTPQAYREHRKKNPNLTVHESVVVGVVATVLSLAIIHAACTVVYLIILWLLS